MIDITENNYVIIAAKAYQPVCLSQEDFIKDVKFLDQIKADITRYLKTKDEGSLRILINRFVIASNNFGPFEAMRLTMFIVRKHYQHIIILKTLFVFLNIFPHSLHITSTLVIDDKFMIDEDLLRELQHASKIQ